MNKFAKLFERDGRQVLVTRGTDDEGAPYMAFETVTKTGGRLKASMLFTKGKKADCKANRDEKFETLTQQIAFEVVESLKGFEL